MTMYTGGYFFRGHSVYMATHYFFQLQQRLFHSKIYYNYSDTFSIKIRLLTARTLLTNSSMRLAGVQLQPAEVVKSNDKRRFC